MKQRRKPLFVRGETRGELEVETGLEAIDDRGSEVVGPARIAVFGAQVRYHVLDRGDTRLFGALDDRGHMRPPLQPPASQREADEPVEILETAQGGVGGTDSRERLPPQQGGRAVGKPARS